MCTSETNPWSQSIEQQPAGTRTSADVRYCNSLCEKVLLRVAAWLCWFVTVGLYYRNFVSGLSKIFIFEQWMMQSVLAPPTLNFLFAKCSQSQVSHLKMCEMLLKGPHLGYSPSTMLSRYNRRKKAVIYCNYVLHFLPRFNMSSHHHRNHRYIRR